MIDIHHPLIRLGLCIDWSSFEATLGATYHPSHGAPGISTRMIEALHCLKYQHDLSDGEIVALRVGNPCWQHFNDERYLQHRMPIDPSSITRWRKRLPLVSKLACGEQHVHTLARPFEQSYIERRVRF